ncbi:MAG: DUF6197 family protein [Mycobacterium sp.]
MTVRDSWKRPSHDLVIERLSEARELVRAGWVQGQSHAVIDGQDCYCPNGAVSKVCGTVRLSPTEIIPGAWIRDAVSAALLAAVPSRFVTVPGYNDRDGRTQDEAVELFTTAIRFTSRSAA